MFFKLSHNKFKNQNRSILLLFSILIISAGYLYSAQGNGCGCLPGGVDSLRCNCSRPYSSHWLWGFPCAGSGSCECGWGGCKCGKFCWKSDMQCATNRECMGNQDWAPPEDRPRQGENKPQRLTDKQARMMIKTNNVNLDKLNAENQWQIMSTQFKTMNKRSRNLMSQDYQKAMRSGAFLKTDAKQWKKIIAEYKTRQSFEKWATESGKTWDSLKKQEKSALIMDEYERLTAEVKEQLSTIPDGDRLFNKWKKLAKNEDLQRFDKNKKTLNQSDVQRFIFDEWASLDKNDRKKTKKTYQSKMPAEIWAELESQEIVAESQRKEDRKKKGVDKSEDLNRSGNRKGGKILKDKNKEKRKAVLKQKDLRQSTRKQGRMTLNQRDWETLTEKKKEGFSTQGDWEQISSREMGKGGKQEDWKVLGEETRKTQGQQRDWELLSKREEKNLLDQIDREKLVEREGEARRTRQRPENWKELSDKEKEEAIKQMKNKKLNQREKEEIGKIENWDQLSEEEKRLALNRNDRDWLKEKESRKLLKQKEGDLLDGTENRATLKRKDWNQLQENEQTERLSGKNWEKFNNREKRQARQEYLDLEIQALRLKEKIGKKSWDRLADSDIKLQRAEIEKKIGKIRKKTSKKEWKKISKDYRELTKGKAGKISNALDKLSKEEKQRLFFETYHTAKHDKKQGLSDFFIKTIGKEGWKKQEKQFNQKQLNESWKKIYIEARQQMKKDFILGRDVQHLSDDDWRHLDDWQKRKAVKDYYQRLDESARSQLSEEYRIRMVMEEFQSLSDIDRAKYLQIEENRKLYKRWKEMNPERKEQLDKDLQKKIYFQQWLELKFTSEITDELERLQNRQEAFRQKMGKSNIKRISDDASKWLSHKLKMFDQGDDPVFKNQKKHLEHNFKRILRDRNWSRMAHTGDKYYSYRMGIIAMSQKEYAEAIKHFQKEIDGGGTDRRFPLQNSLSEIDYFPYREMGISYYYLRKYPQATQALEKSLKYQKSGRAEYYLMKTRENEQGIECIAARAPKLTFRVEAKDSGTSYITGRVKSKFYLSSFSINQIPIPVEDTGTKMSFEFPVDDYDDTDSITIEAVNLCGMAKKVSVPISQKENDRPSILAQKNADPAKNLKIMISYHRSRQRKEKISNAFVPLFAKSLKKSGRFQVQIVDPIAEGFSVKEITKFSKLCALAQGVEADLLLLLTFKIEENSMEVIARFLDPLTHHQVVLEEIYREDVRQEVLPVMADKLTQKVLRDLPNMEGHIIKSKKGMVAIDLGKNQGITMGRKFLIYKKDSLEYIGELIINKLFPDISGGKTMLISPVVWVDVGDLVIAK